MIESKTKKSKSTAATCSIGSLSAKKGFKIKSFSKGPNGASSEYVGVTKTSL
jgi:hypothetical protein